ncbi:MAG TPA: FtsW/RodA/SpoVE family cell cycle protein, partial [Gemmatimonadaceae bacterium]|nr:FtsW/RodA/SpoVE family cell cycle protein [Gemmatimonadaceae bacterium]
MSRPIVSDYRLLTAAAVLSVFGVAMVYSAGQTDTPTAVATVYKSQILWLLIGLGFAYAVGHSSVRFIEWMTTPLFLLSVFLLALTLVIGKGAGTAASTKSWLAIGSHRIGQPSE